MPPFTFLGMSIMYASSSDTFYKYYAARQRGGALASVDGIPVFRASRRSQGGAGLGDVLRSAFRWFLPVALRGASAFANAFLKSHDQGATFTDAAKSAIAPTLSVAARAVRRRMAAKESRQQGAAEVAASTEQTGSGRKRRRRVYKGRTKRSKRSKKSAKKRHQVGLGRRKRKSKKQQGLGRRKKAKKTQKRRRRRATSPSITSYNF